MLLLFAVITTIASYFGLDTGNKSDISQSNSDIYYEISDIPEYSGEIYIEINGNVPKFTSEDLNIKEDYYSTLNNGRVRNGYGKDKL